MSTIHSEAHSIEIAEQVCSALSIAGAIFIIMTFALGATPRLPVNKLIFYACWGNLFTSIATCISRHGILAGATSILCEFQAFLIQWFLLSNALWTLAMACNAYLANFHRYDLERLRSLEWKYFVLCYGLPFIPAFIFCFINTADRGRVYGPATLWCWVSPQWGILRIATFYGPVWLTIIINIFIYFKVGRLLVRQKQKMSNLRTHNSSVEWEEGGFRLRKNSSRTTISSHPNLSDCPRKHRSINSSVRSYSLTVLLLIFVAIVTWVPSTVNRVYALFSPSSTSPYALEVASGAVLSLQGFWNAVIYTVTSWRGRQAMWADTADRPGTSASTSIPDLGKHNDQRCGSRAAQTSRPGTAQHESRRIDRRSPGDGTIEYFSPLNQVEKRGNVKEPACHSQEDQESFVDKRPKCAETHEKGNGQVSQPTKVGEDRIGVAI